MNVPGRRPKAGDRTVASEGSVDNALNEVQEILDQTAGDRQSPRGSAMRAALANLAARVTAERDAQAALTLQSAADADRSTEAATAVDPLEVRVEPQPHSLLRPFRIGFVGGLGVLIAYVSFLAADSIRSTLVVIAVAAILAIGLDPAVSRLTRHRVPRGWAVTIVFLLLIGFIAAAMVAIVPPVILELGKLIQSIPSFIDSLGQNETIKSLDERYGIISQIENSNIVQNLVSTTGGSLLTAGAWVAAVLGDLFIVLVLTLFLLAGLPRIKSGAWRLVPASRRLRVAELGEKVINQMGGYLSGAFLVALQAGVVAGLFAAIVGLPYPFAIALGAFILDFIPVVGPIIVGISMTVIGLTQSVTLGIVAGVFYIVQHMFETYWLYPRVMRRQVNISIGAVVLAIILGAALLGVTGAILAVPVAAAVQLIFREVVLPRQNTR